MAIGEAQRTFPPTVFIKDVTVASIENFLAIVLGVSRKPDSLNY
jgi:hypothetical protein